MRQKGLFNSEGKEEQRHECRGDFVWWKRVDFIAGALHLWSNVETVHRTVSLSLLASQASAFAPISGPNPLCLYKNKNQSQKWLVFIWWKRVDSNHRSWIATDLQSVPFGRSGTLPYWSWWTDSNPWPADYKSAALPTELHQRISNA